MDGTGSWGGVTPEHVAAAQVSFEAAALALSGKFNEQIKALQEEQEKLAVANETGATLSQAKAALEEANQVLRDTQAQADSTRASADAMQDSAAASVLRANKLVIDAETRAAQTEKSATELEGRWQAFEDECGVRTSDLDSRQAAIVTMEAQTKADADEVAVLKAKLQDRLAQLAAV